MGGLALFAANPISTILGILLACSALFTYIERTEIRALNAEKAALVAQRATLGNTIRDQNEAVLALQRAASVQAATTAQAATDAAKILAESQTRVATLLHATVPKNCTEAMKWLGQHVAKPALSK